MFATTAREVMVPLEKYAHATATQTLREAAEALDRNKIEIGDRVSMPRILLVFDEDGQVLGVARRRDILRGLEPDFHLALEGAHPEAHLKTEIDPNLTDLVGPEDLDRLRHRMERPLSEVVRELPAVVAPDDSLLKVIRELVANDSHMAAVIDDDDNFLGVVRSLDVLRVVRRALR